MLPGATIAALNLAQGAAVSTISRRDRHVPLSRARSRVLRRHGFPARIHRAQVRARRSPPRTDQAALVRARDCGSRRRGPRLALLTARGHAPERAGIQPAAGHDRPAAQGPRFHDARQPGAGRQPGAEARGHLDRRLERLGEPLRRQRRRDHEPAQRRVGPRRPAGVRRRDPGEVERVHRRVRRLDRRRHQRRDEERHQHVARRRAGQLRRRRARRRATADPPQGTRRTRRAPST